MKMSKISGELKPKLIRLRASRVQWEAPIIHTINPYAKFSGKGKTAAADRTMRFVTVSYELPLDTMHIETIVIDGRVVWDFKGDPVRSAILGGGGRFKHERKFYERQMVQQCLLIRDLPFYTRETPKLDVILSKFVPSDPVIKQLKGASK